MEATHHDNNTLLSLLLGFIGFIVEITRQVVDNYDSTFKVLTIVMLSLAVVVNLDKAVKVVWNYIVLLWRAMMKK